MTMADIFGSRLTKLPQSSNTMDRSCVDRAGISLLSHSLAAKVQRRNLVGATAVVQQIHAESAKKRLALLHGDDEHRADWVCHSQVKMSVDTTLGDKITATSWAPCEPKKRAGAPAPPAFFMRWLKVRASQGRVFLGRHGHLCGRHHKKPCLRRVAKHQLRSLI